MACDAAMEASVDPTLIDIYLSSVILSDPTWYEQTLGTFWESPDIRAGDGGYVEEPIVDMMDGPQPGGGTLVPLPSVRLNGCKAMRDDR